jgi:hypothetical protein
MPQPGTAPVPFLLQATPPSAVPGSDDLTVTLSGTGFVSGATVNWNGVSLSTTFVTQRQIAAIIPASDLATPGTHYLTVINPGTTTASNPVLFPVATPIAFPGYMYTTSIGSGTDAGPVLATDLNNDGKADIVAYGSGGMATVLLGNGDGTFNQLPSFFAGYSSSLLSVGDLNGDGIPDLVGTTCGTDPTCNSGFSLQVFLGNGDGTFRPPITRRNIPFLGTAPALGDFNGDGKLDIAYAGHNSQDQGLMAVFLGNGDGTFGPLRQYSGFDNPSSIATADLNGDGILDLAVANQTGDFVGALLGNGDGTFQPQIVVKVKQHPVSVTLADLNDDGIPDLAVGYGSGAVYAVLLGNGDGTFQSPHYYQTGSPAPMGVGDFNGDGKLDLSADPGVIVLGNGDGTFVEPYQEYGFTPPATGFANLIGDFNGDGRLDFAASSATALAATAQQGTVTLTRTRVQFPATPVGQTSTAQPVILTNIGQTSLLQIAKSIFGSDSSDFSLGGFCGGALSAGKSCTMLITFSPRISGSRTATLQIKDSAPGGAQYVTLQGMGTN